MKRTEKQLIKEYTLALTGGSKNQKIANLLSNMLVEHRGIIAYKIENPE